jgi:hypothetical protein
MGNIGIIEPIRLIIGIDTLIVQIILIESVGGLYEEFIVGSTDILHRMIRQMILPGAYLGRSPEA